MGEGCRFLLFSTLSESMSEPEHLFLFFVDLHTVDAWTFILADGFRLLVEGVVVFVVVDGFDVRDNWDRDLRYLARFSLVCFMISSEGSHLLCDFL